MSNVGIGARMKENYENPYFLKLPMRIPIIIRVDGKAFHSFTRGMGKPFDPHFELAMERAARRLCEEIMGAQIAYVQSDEISILVHNYKRLVSQGWLGNELQKIVSISAGIASSFMSLTYGRTAVFDSRVFVIPEAEVCNYFIWRQQDATRNSILGVAQSLYSHKELQGRKGDELQEMIFQKGYNWNDWPVHQKRGRCVRRVVDPDYENRSEWSVDRNIPIFTQDRAYIEQFLETEE